VPASQAGQATDFLEAYFSAQAEAPPEEEEEEEGGRCEAAAGQRAPLRPLLAAGSAFLTFGVGHVYARRPVTAAALLAGQAVAMVFLFGGGGWYEWSVGLTALFGIVGCDVVGSMLAARAHARGVRRGRAWQAALGASYVGGALILAVAVGPRLSDPKAGDPTGGWRRVQQRSPLDRIDRPLEREPSFPPIVSEHPANPMARHRQ
jgi:hypothetical protein